MAAVADFSPGSQNTSSSAISRNINDILSILESPAGSPASTPVGTPVKTGSETPKSDILNGVVAYVEVRGDNENRSRAIERELHQLGATIAHKLDPEVTHVVFKDGKKSTRTRAEKRQLHLVSVLWLESCKQTGSRVPEKMFPVAKVEEGTPVFARLKKSKSMQPKDFDEDVANSAERGVKRRRRAELMAERWKKALPNSPSLRRFFVEETQPRSPSSPYGTSDITIPDTPPSMRNRMDNLLHRQLTGDRSNPSNTPVVGGKVASPLQRRLFVNTGPSSTSSDPQTPLHVSPGRSNNASPRQAKASTTTASPAHSPSLASPSSRTRLRSQSSEEESPSLMTRLKKRLSGSVNSPLYNMHAKSLGISPRSRRNSAAGSPSTRNGSPQTEVNTGCGASVDEVFLPENKPLTPISPQVGGPGSSRKRRRSSMAVEESEDPLPPEMAAAPVTAEEKPDNPAVKRKSRKSLAVTKDNTPTGDNAEGSKPLQKSKRRKSTSVIADSAGLSTEASAPAEFVKPDSDKNKPAPKRKGRRSMAATVPNALSPAIDTTGMNSTGADIRKPEDCPAEHISSDNVVNVSADSGTTTNKPQKRKLLSLSVSESCLPSFPVEANKSSEANRSKERLFEPKKKPIKGVKKSPVESLFSVSKSKTATSGRKVKSLSPRPAQSKPVRSSRRKSMHPTVPLASDDLLPETSPLDTSAPEVAASKAAFSGAGTSEATSSNEAAESESISTVAAEVAKPRTSARRKSMNPALLRQSDGSADVSSSKVENTEIKKTSRRSLSVKPKQDLTPEINKTGKITKISTSNSPQKTKSKLKKSVTLSLKKPADKDTSVEDIKRGPVENPETEIVSAENKPNNAIVVKSRRRKSVIGTVVTDEQTSVNATSGEKSKTLTRRRSACPQLSTLTDEKSGPADTSVVSNCTTVDSIVAAVAILNSAVPKLPARRRSMRRSLAPSPLDVSTQNLFPADLESTDSHDTGISSTTDEPLSRLKEQPDPLPGPSVPSRSRHNSDSGMSDVDSNADTLSEVSLPGCHKGRPSVDEFKVVSFRNPEPCDTPDSVHSHSMSRLASEITNTTSIATNNKRIDSIKSVKPKSRHTKPSTAKPVGAKKVAAKPQKANKSAAASKKTSPPDKKSSKPTLVMTSLHFPEQDSVHAVVKKLGGFHIVNKVLDSTTHIVIGNNRRTLNVLYAMVQGCWILSLEWVLKSLEADCWLPEKEYETDFFPAAPLYRQEREASSVPYKPQVFHEQGLIYVTEETAPPQEHLTKLISLAGGQVTTCLRKADLSIGMSSRSDLKAVADQWVLDSITSHQCLPHDEYELGIKNRIRSPSPDF